MLTFVCPDASLVGEAFKRRLTGLTDGHFARTSIAHNQLYKCVIYVYTYVCIYIIYTYCTHLYDFLRFFHISSHITIRSRAYTLRDTFCAFVCVCSDIDKCK